jgi:hypothetical protein
LILINFNAFLAFCFLGAGLDKRTRKPLGAHQQSFDDHSEREHGCLRFTDGITFWIFDIMRLFTSTASFLIITLHASLLSLTARLLCSVRQEFSPR